MAVAGGRAGDRDGRCAAVPRRLGRVGCRRRGLGICGPPRPVSRVAPDRLHLRRGPGRPPAGPAADQAELPADRRRLHGRLPGGRTRRHASTLGARQHRPTAPGRGRRPTRIRAAAHEFPRVDSPIASVMWSDRLSPRQCRGPAVAHDQLRSPDDRRPGSLRRGPSCRVPRVRRAAARYQSATTSPASPRARTP